MDLLSAFKSEIFRPFVTLVVPGAIGVTPYVLLLHYYVNRIQHFSNEHLTAFGAMVSIAVLATGLIMEDLGSLIETKVWDKAKDSKDASRQQIWDSYMKLPLKDELVGQRYLRGILVRMKFELSMVPALLFFWVGLVWLNHVQAIWAWSRGFLFISAAIFALGAYLLWESGQSSKLLFKTQTLMVEAQREGVIAVTPRPN